MNAKCIYTTGILQLLLTLATALFSICAQGQNPANIVQNWSFENITGSQALPWTGDYVVGTGQAANGTSFIQPIGFVDQTLTTIPGQEYEVTFAVSGYQGTAIIDLSWDGNFIGDSVWTGNSVYNFDWVSRIFDVTATGDSTVLGLQADPQAITSSYLDAVQVVPIPEPSTWLLAGVGGLALVIFRKLSFRNGK